MYDTAAHGVPARVDVGIPGDAGRRLDRDPPFGVQGHARELPEELAQPGLTDPEHRQIGRQLAAVLEPEGDFVELGRVDPPRDLGQFGRIDLTKPLPATIELRLEPEHGLEHLGVSLRRAAQEETLLARAEAVLAVATVEAEPNYRGTKTAGCAVGLRRHCHLEESLSPGFAVDRHGERPRVPCVPRQPVSPRESYRLIADDRTAPPG